MVAYDPLNDPHGRGFARDPDIMRQPLFGIVPKYDRLGSSVQQSNVSERQFRFELPFDLLGGFLTVAYAFRFALAVVVDEHVPFAAFLADFHTHTAVLMTKVNDTVTMPSCALSHGGASSCRSRTLHPCRGLRDVRHFVR